MVLNAKQVLALPLEGILVATDTAPTILEGDVSDIEALLPRLTKGQYQSIYQIVLTDVSSSNELEVSAETFKKLNEFGPFARTTNGLNGIESIVDKNGKRAPIVVSGTVTELTNINKLNNYTNFFLQVTDLDIILESVDDQSSVKDILSNVVSNVSYDIISKGVTYTAAQLTKLLQEYPTVSFEDVAVRDTELNLQGLFDTTNQTLARGISKVTSFTSTDADSSINLDWSKISNLVDTTSSTSIGDFISKVGVDHIVVSGTAEQLTEIFKKFGTDFKTLPAGVEFNITDGGEVKLSPSELEKLDGRIRGAVVVDELTSTYFDKSPSASVKDVEIGSKDLFLTVDQFRNAPDYLDKTGDLVIKDSTVNIKAALDFSVFDDRVDAIIVDDSTSISLSVAQVQNLGNIKVNGNLTNDLNDYTRYVSAEIIVADRSSAIASFIESGDFPVDPVTLISNDLKDNGDPHNIEDAGVISLNYEQTLALDELARNYKINLPESDLTLQAGPVPNSTKYYDRIMEKYSSNGTQWKFTYDDIYTRLTFGWMPMLSSKLMIMKLRLMMSRRLLMTFLMTPQPVAPTKVVDEIPADTKPVVI